MNCTTRKKPGCPGSPQLYTAKLRLVVREGPPMNCPNVCGLLAKQRTSLALVSMAMCAGVANLCGISRGRHWERKPDCGKGAQNQYQLSHGQFLLCIISRRSCKENAAALPFVPTGTCGKENPLVGRVGFALRGVRIVT